MMDVARQVFKEAQDDSFEYVKNLGSKYTYSERKEMIQIAVGEYHIAMDMKYETRRQFYIRIPTTELVDRELPTIFTNTVKRKGYLECQTIALLKFNQKVWHLVLVGS
jgi:DNA mismatch repair protein MSH4